MKRSSEALSNTQKPACSGFGSNRMELWPAYFFATPAQCAIMQCHVEVQDSSETELNENVPQTMKVFTFP